MPFEFLTDLIHPTEICWRFLNYWNRFFLQNFCHYSCTIQNYFLILKWIVCVFGIRCNGIEVNPIIRQYFFSDFINLGKNICIIEILALSLESTTLPKDQRTRMGLLFFNKGSIVQYPMVYSKASGFPDH